MTKVASICIRSDGNSKIGSGHFFRVRTLLEAIHDLDNSAVFYWTHYKELPFESERSFHINFSEFKSNRLFNTLSGVSKNQWLENHWLYDAFIFCFKNYSHKPTYVIVDHYGLDSKWETVVRLILNTKILVIDDLADRRHNCDIVVDVTREEPGSYLELVRTDTRLLLGPRWAIVRDEFTKIRKHSDTPRTGKYILLFLGGFPNESIFKLLLDAIRKSNFKDMYIKLITHDTNFNRSNLSKFSEAKSVEILYSPNKIGEEILNSYFLISSASTFCWEACTVGRGGVCLVTADNQVSTANILEKKGAFKKIDLRRLAGSSQRKISSELDKFSSEEIRKANAEAKDVVDGLGKHRICKEMIRISDEKSTNNIR